MCVGQGRGVTRGSGNGSWGSGGWWGGGGGAGGGGEGARGGRCRGGGGWGDTELWGGCERWGFGGWCGDGGAGAAQGESGLELARRAVTRVQVTWAPAWAASSAWRGQEPSTNWMMVRCAPASARAVRCWAMTAGSPVTTAAPAWSAGMPNIPSGSVSWLMSVSRPGRVGSPSMATMRLVVMVGTGRPKRGACAAAGGRAGGGGGGG